MWLHRLPCPIEAETRHCARREFASARWNQLGRVGVGKLQGEIMRPWIVSDQKHAVRALGKVPEVVPYFLLRYVIDPSFEVDLWRLDRLGNGVERLPCTHGRRTDHQVRRDLRPPEIGCYRPSRFPATLAERPVMVVQTGILPTRFSVA